MKFLKELSIGIGIGLILVPVPLYLTYRTQNRADFLPVWIDELIALAFAYVIYDLLKHK
jgi:NhaP-type Na+/H+ or K+/H+ antiporter